MARVAIVIVTYNSEAEIARCANSVRDIPDIEVVIVDNASSDRTRELAAACSVPVIANETNTGFAAAVNQGVRATTAPLILLLNPDACLMSGLDTLAGEFEDPRVGAAGGMLIDESGRPQAGFMARNLPTPAALAFEALGINRQFPRNPVNWRYRCLGLDPVIPANVEQPAGAFLMFRRSVWKNTGGFDERFWPVWFEDVDFCARLKQAGLNVRYNPAAVAVHRGGHSVGVLSLEIRERYWYGSLLEYASKYYSSMAFRAVCFAVFIGAAFRGLRGYPRYGLNVFAVYGAVCRLAASRIFGRRRDRKNTVV